LIDNKKQPGAFGNAESARLRGRGLAAAIR